MRKRLFLICIAVILPLLSPAEQYISGDLSGVLEEDIYIVTGQINVQDGDSLWIEPGAEFYFDGGFGFDIFGYLYAEGTETDSITFQPNVGIPQWDGIDFFFEAGDSSVLGYCLITGCNPSAIYVYGRAPRFHNCTISGNYTDNSGGGIYIHEADPLIENCLITNNRAFLRGGGIYVEDSESTVIKNCIISGDSAQYGAGIYLYQSSGDIIGCEISDNGAAIGGGIHIDRSLPFIQGCRISGNRATQSYSSSGGGILCEYSNAVIKDCVIENNLAWWMGGGICCQYHSDSYIENCTIYGNHGGDGGGFASFTWASPVVYNTIIAGNTGCGAYFGAEAAFEYCGFYGNHNGNFQGAVPPDLGVIALTNANGDSCDVFSNIFFDPLFYSVSGDSAYYLTEDSPCIDAGNPLSPPDPDLTTADIGAYYYDQGTASTITLTLTPYNPPIQIPANGGAFDYNILIENSGASPLSFQVWIMAVLPSGAVYGPIAGPAAVSINPGISINRDRMQNVPASAPAGTYIYTVYAGLYPDYIADEDSFEFEKIE
ncbi:right-handed parallel beta-helix repeat-containing protein [bacterium]|nr:right-handed parallel beta-helix repeat-containing protein [bacterium]